MSKPKPKPAAPARPLTAKLVPMLVRLTPERASLVARLAAEDLGDLNLAVHAARLMTKVPAKRRKLITRCALVEATAKRKASVPLGQRIAASHASRAAFGVNNASEAKVAAAVAKRVEVAKNNEALVAAIRQTTTGTQARALLERARR